MSRGRPSEVRFPDSRMASRLPGALGSKAETIEARWWGGNECDWWCVQWGGRRMREDIPWKSGCGWEVMGRWWEQEQVWCMISYTTLNLDWAGISKTGQSRCQLPLTSEASSVPRILRGEVLVLICSVVTTGYSMGPPQLWLKEVMGREE